MKLVKMTKTTAGPSGVFPVGARRHVSDEEAAQLVAAEAAEVIRSLDPVGPVEADAPDPNANDDTKTDDADPNADDDADPNAGTVAETAAVNLVLESAILPSPQSKVKRVR